MKKSSTHTVSDLLSLAESALSVLLGAQKEMQSHLEGKRDSIIRKLDLVTHEEFDAAFAMLKKIRVTQSDLEKRIKKLEEKKTMSRPQKPPIKKQIRPKK